MARPLRLEYEGALYHITSRGNARDNIFTDDRDRHRFLEILSDSVKRHMWVCHAYCLMTNHYHLIIETPAAGLARGMQLLNGVYTQWFNHRHNRVGHLFQGRYKAILVEKESYLLELVRYVAMNPVRAGMVQTAADWPWSSYLATAGQVAIPDFLIVDWILSQLGTDRPSAVVAYRKFVQEENPASVWDNLQAGLFLGSDQFVNRHRPFIRQKPLDPEFRSRERFAARPSLSELFKGVADKATRNERIYQAVRVYRYTLKEVADHLGLLYSTISVIAKKVDRMEKS
jgi:REP element-mobilizing transposase RayT